MEIHEVIDEVVTDFIKNDKFNLLPKSLLDVKELRAAKTSKEHSKFGYERPKQIIESDSD